MTLTCVIKLSNTRTLARALKARKRVRTMTIPHYRRFEAVLDEFIQSKFPTSAHCYSFDDVPVLGKRKGCAKSSPQDVTIDQRRLSELYYFCYKCLYDRKLVETWLKRKGDENYQQKLRAIDQILSKRGIEDPNSVRDVKWKFQIVLKDLSTDYVATYLCPMASSKVNKMRQWQSAQKMQPYS